MYTQIPDDPDYLCHMVLQENETVLCFQMSVDYRITQVNNQRHQVGGHRLDQYCVTDAILVPLLLPFHSVTTSEYSNHTLLLYSGKNLIFEHMHKL